MSNLKQFPAVRQAARAESGDLRHLRVFEKCRQFTRAHEIEAKGLYPYFREISDSEDTVVVIEGRERLMLGSNNYLGLTQHPKVVEAAEKALRSYGSGCTGSRFMNGTLDLHTKLEAALAEDDDGIGILKTASELVDLCRAVQRASLTDIDNNVPHRAANKPVHS